MKHWPAPKSFSKNIPALGSSGSFWEDRDDRYHCGIDIYAPEGSAVVSIEDSKVIEIDVFTSPKKIPYWNTTYYILLKNKTGYVCKYAELRNVTASIDKIVEAGQLIGQVGLVLNTKKITENSPLYIKKIKRTGNNSMLHFELYNLPPNLFNKYLKYLGGNWFGSTKPKNLLDPTNYLTSILKTTPIQQR